MAKKPTKKLDEIGKKFGADREKALNDALKLIEKDFGKGSIMRLGERAEQKVQVMSSGSLALDIALGSGGYPKGRIIEIYGPESSGKTTVALHAVAQAQKEGGIAAFIDAEHALDPAYAAALGVNIDELLLSQPDSGEQGLEIAGKLIDSGAVDLVVIDSVAALVPRAEIDGDIGDSHGPECVLHELGTFLARPCQKVLYSEQFSKFPEYYPTHFLKGQQYPHQDFY